MPKKFETNLPKVGFKWILKKLKEVYNSFNKESSLNPTKAEDLDTKQKLIGMKNKSKTHFRKTKKPGRA